MSAPRTKRTLAQRADRHELYQMAVQAPDFEIEFFEDHYKELRGKRPLILREDFCGTALVCVEWCKSHPKRRAIGVDLCADTLEWGRKHNLLPAGKDVAARVTLLNANVLAAPAPKADISCAMNFSYCIFKTRGALRHYFETTRAGLKDDGLFVLDLLGGTETMTVVKEEHAIDDSDVIYVWEQAKFNPITHDYLTHIHFRFPDGSRLKRAFTYEWRLWTLPEIHELLREAGFRAVHVYWEGTEENPDDPDQLRGNGEYAETTEAENQEAWIAYIVAEA